MEKSYELNENLMVSQRKPYFKPQIEIVPLLPKQTVLSNNCYSTSIAGPLTVGCGSLIDNCVDI